METPAQYASIIERMDSLIGSLRTDLMAQMAKLATTDALTTLSARVGRIEDRIESMPRRPVEANQLADVERRVEALEAAPKVAAERKGKELQKLAGIIGAIVAVVGACNGCAGVALSAAVQVLLHVLK